jgi:hypothetical protein
MTIFTWRHFFMRVISRRAYNQSTLCSVLLLFIFMVATLYAHADVTIPVTSGTSPTCLGSLYSTILVPGGWGAITDTTIATTFAQSDTGILGLTLYFEVQPNSAYPSPGEQAMNAMAFAFMNTHLASNITPTSYSTFKSQIKYQSAVWSRQSDGSGNLVSPESTELPTVLNGSPTSGSCIGLLYSWTLAQNYVSYYFNGVSTAAGHTAAYSIDVTNQDANPTSQEIFFNATGSLPSVSSSRKYNLYSVGTFNSPSGAPNYFWGINDAKLLNPPYPNFY